MSDDKGSLIEVSADFLFDDPNVSYYGDDEFRDESKIHDDFIEGNDVSQPVVNYKEFWNFGFQNTVERIFLWD